MNRNSLSVKILGPCRKNEEEQSDAPFTSLKHNGLGILLFSGLKMESTGSVSKIPVGGGD